VGVGVGVALASEVYCFAVFAVESVREEGKGEGGAMALYDNELMDDDDDDDDDKRYPS